MALTSERTLFQDTILRTSDAALFAAPVVVGNDEHRFILAQQLRELGVAPGALVVEPVGRNTAPAAAAAALLLTQDEGDALMLVMPADHVIADAAAFGEAVGRALAAAAGGRLVSFGIEPTAPHSGYGYIRKGDPVPSLPGCFVLDRFVEKPDAVAARAWVDSGEYLWNSGIFLFPAARYLEEVERRQPAIVAACREALARGGRDLSFLRLDAGAFAGAPSISIDYAVMEHLDGGIVVPVRMGWSDVGSWSALWEISGKDEAGNATHGSVIAVDTADSLLRTDGPAIAALGLRDVVLVATKDPCLPRRASVRRTSARC